MSDLRPLRDASWWDDAACKGRDPDLFFPVKGATAIAARAKRICATCPVIDRCLTYALDNTVKHGVWGGMSEKERRVLRRGRPTPRRCLGCGHLFHARGPVQTCSPECRSVLSQRSNRTWKDAQ